MPLGRSGIREEPYKRFSRTACARSWPVVEYRTARRGVDNAHLFLRRAAVWREQIENLGIVLLGETELNVAESGHVTRFRLDGTAGSRHLNPIGCDVMSSLSENTDKVASFPVLWGVYVYVDY